MINYNFAALREERLTEIKSTIVTKSKFTELISQMSKSISENGINAEELIPNLKELRKFAIADQNPRLTKALRFTYEHLEAYNGFFIAQPEDEILNEEGEVIAVTATEDADHTGSLLYFLSIIQDAHNKMNAEEIKEYIMALKAYAEEN